MYYTNAVNNKRQFPEIRSLLLHSMGFISGDPSIVISYPYVFHSGLQVSVTEPGDCKWIYLMLPIDKGSLITNIKIDCQQSPIQKSHVSGIMLLEQQTPDTSLLLHDETIQKPTSCTGMINFACQAIVNHSILLKVCMNFVDKEDVIDFGSLEISYIPDYVSLPNNIKELFQFTQKKEMSSNNLFNNIFFLNSSPSILERIFFKRKETICTNKKICM